MKKVWIIVLIIAIGYFAGYGLGKATMKISKNHISPEPPEVVGGRMTPEVMLAMGRLSSPALSPDGSRIVYSLGRADFGSDSFVSGLRVCAPDGSDDRALSGTDGASCPVWSPRDGKYLYFVQDSQIWMAPFRRGRLGRKVAVTDVPAGVSEFSISPDGHRVIYTSTIPNPAVRKPSDTNPDLGKATAYETEDLMYRHWDHWVTDIPRSYVAGLDGRRITPSNSTDILGDEPYELPAEPFGGVCQLCWSPDSRRIAYSCRKLSGIRYAFSTNACIYVYDVADGTSLQLTCTGGYDTDPVWSPDGKSLAWISMERDGYEADRQRIMVASVGEDGSFSGPRELTRGFVYDAQGIVWTPDSKNIVFPATLDAVGALCMVNVEGEPSVRRLTPEEWPVSFGAPFVIDSGEDGSLSMLSTCQSMDFPTELCKVSVPASGVASYGFVTAVNREVLEQIDPVRTERIVLDTPSGEKLHCWVIYPPHFDPSSKWPGVEMFNGGPQSSLDQTWSYRWNFRLMAQQGYVVVLPNRHGDSGFGQAWKEQISGDYQGLNMQDYMVAARWFRSQPWAGKLGGVGASYGGFSVYNMMGLHGDLFDCFISHAGIFNERQLWYTTEEMWFSNWDNGGLTEYAFRPGETGPAGDGVTFGGMQQAGAPYSKTAKALHHYADDPEAKVLKWHTPLLCIHGMNDFRIPYEQGMAAFNAARMMGVPSRLIIFPDECHWVLKPQNSLYWHREFYGWLDKWLK
ncbi:MAG: S9 family peptidase [Bacteroidales bacterium]|nr:S9 family peptidase [Bacteroidales bacterium]